jgi:hypothetical protein
MGHWDNIVPSIMSNHYHRCTWSHLCFQLPFLLHRCLPRRLPCSYTYLPIEKAKTLAAARRQSVASTMRSVYVESYNTTQGGMAYSWLVRAGVGWVRARRRGGGGVHVDVKCARQEHC